MDLRLPLKVEKLKKKLKKKGLFNTKSKNSADSLACSCVDLVLTNQLRPSSWERHL